MPIKTKTKRNILQNKKNTGTYVLPVLNKNHHRKHIINVVRVAIEGSIYTLYCVSVCVCVPIKSNKLLFYLILKLIHLCVRIKYK